MIATPFDVFIYNVGVSPIPSTITLTIGSQSAQGGVGVFGYGQLADLCAIVGPGGGPASGPVPTAKVLQGGVVGTAYSETISAQGGTAPYTFALTVGSLPAGLSLNGATGAISGTPTTVQAADFTIQATDANAVPGSTAFEISVTNASSGGAKVCAYVA